MPAGRPISQNAQVLSPRQTIVCHATAKAEYSTTTKSAEICRVFLAAIRFSSNDSRSNTNMGPDSELYSYRTDPRVPPFDDRNAVAVMDGECALCSFGARLIVRFDRRQRIRLCPVQSDLGSALLTHYGIEPIDPESWLFLSDGRAWTSFDAWIKAAEHCGGIGRLMSVFRLVPRPLRDWIYCRVARNRITLFGRTDMCALPDARVRARLIGIR